MKKCKILMSIILAFLFVPVLLAQEDQPTMFVVHQDNVKFEMMPQYEAAAKELVELCKKNNIQMPWTTISVEDGRYIHVSPIKSMADLDKNPLASLDEKVGKEAMAKLWAKYDECYDSHRNEIAHYIPELSYNPEGVSNEGKNFREYHFLYFAPKNGKKMKEAMKAVKEMFKAKGSKAAYNVYSSGFGSPESYYMVSIAGENQAETAKNGMENDKLLGDERKAVFFNVIKLASKYDQVLGNIRPDLSYAPAK